MVKKSKADMNIWKYNFQNRITLFFEIAESIRKDFFKDNEEIKNFIRLLKLELVKTK